MRKSIVLIGWVISIFMCSNIYAQPALDLIYSDTIVPTLNIQQLENMEDIKALHFRQSRWKKEGVVLFHPKSDEWQSYHKLSDYQELGNIQFIQQWNNTLLIAANDATLVVNQKTKEESLLDIKCHSAFKEGNKLYIIPKTYDHPNENKTINIIQLSLTDGTQTLISNNNAINANIKSAFYHKGKIYMSQYLQKPDYTQWHNSVMALDGSTIEQNFFDNHHQAIKEFFVYEDKLHFIANDDIYAYDDNTNEVQNLGLDIHAQYIDLHLEADQLFLLCGDNGGKKNFIQQINLEEASMIEMQIESKLLNQRYYFDDLVVDEHHIHLLASHDNHVLKINRNNPTAKRYFPINKGVINRVKTLVEDSEELWVLSKVNSISKYDKNTKSWTNYSKFIDNDLKTLFKYGHYPYTSHPKAQLSIQLNDMVIAKDQLIFTIQTEEDGEVKDLEDQVLLFDRKDQTFKVEDTKKVLQKFLDESGVQAHFENSDNPQNLLNYQLVLDNMSPLEVYAFFNNNLPESWGYFPYSPFNADSLSTTLIEINPESAMQRNYAAIVQYDHQAKELGFYELPKKIKPFGTIENLKITANRSEVWFASAKGKLFNYQITDQKLSQHNSWKKIQNLCYLEMCDDKLLAVSNYDLHVIDTENNQIENTIFYQKRDLVNVPIYKTNNYELFSSFPRQSKKIRYSREGYKDKYLKVGGRYFRTPHHFYVQEYYNFYILADN